jgi:hypothetical protein
VSAGSMGTMAVNGLLGVGANVSVLVGAYGIARYGLRQRRGLSTVLATALVFWVACTIGLEILGTLGALAVGPMFGWGAIVGVIGGAFWWFRAELDHAPSRPAPVEPLSRDAVLSLSLLLAAALVLGMKSLLLGVKVVSDGPIYHLYFAVRWWKAGRLLLVASPFGENAATYFPANGDLWFSWLMATWGGDQLAKIGQAPFLVLAAAAAYACARRLGAGLSASVVATCWFASSTPLLLFSFEPNVDTIFVAGYLVAAYFFVQATQGTGDTGACWLGALAAGAALGTKAVGVVFVPPLLVAAMIAVLVQAVPLRTRLQRALAIVLGPLVAGGFWYVRNALLTGNPLYPLEVRVMGRSVLHGWYLPEAMRTSQYYLPVGNWRALGDILLAVLDPRLAPFWVAALVAGPAVKAKTTDGGRRLIGIFSAMAVLNVALYWLCIPYRTQQRFMLQALGLAVGPLAATLDSSRWLRRAAALLLALHLLTPQGWPFSLPNGSPPWDLTPLIPNAMSDPVQLFARIGRAFHREEVKRSVLGLALLIGIVLCSLIIVVGWGRRPVRSQRSRLRLTLIVASSMFFVGFGYLDVCLEVNDARSPGSSAIRSVVVAWLEGRSPIDPRLRFYPGFPDFFAGWLQIEARSGTAGARVAYAGTNIPYYLMAIGLRNDVRYINIDRHRDWLLHDYHWEATRHGQGNWPNSRPGWDRLSPDFRAWVDNLEAAGIQLLVVTRVNPSEGPHNVADSENFPIERQWADSHPEWFEPLYGQREQDPWFRLYRFRRERFDRLRDDDDQSPEGGPSRRS